jgi:O-antigen ligase
MHNPGIGGWERIRRTSWLHTAFILLRDNATSSNLIGLMGAGCALCLLLGLPASQNWNIRLPFYLVIFVWAMLRPRIALYLMAFAVPWGSLDTMDVAGLHLNAVDILLLPLSVGWLLSFITPSPGRPQGLHTQSPGLRPHIYPTPTRYSAQLQNLASESTPGVGPCDRSRSPVPTYLIWAIMLWLGTMLLSMTAAINISSSLKEIIKWLEFLVLLLLGSQYIRTRQHIWTLVTLICLAGITQACFGYMQAAFALGPVSFIRDTSLRVYGTFDQPNPYAGYINIPLSIALALLLLGSNWTTRIPAALTVVLLAAAEYLTQSRGGELAIAIALLFIVLVGMPRLRKILVLLIPAGLALVELFFAGWIPTYVLNPLLKNLGLIQISFTFPTTEDFSTAERLAHWIAGIRMFLSHPLLGVGIGNYPDAYSRYFITIFINSLGHAHNYYINIAAETGAVGLTAYLLFLMAMFVAGGSAYSSIHKRYQVQVQSSGSTPKPTVLPPFGTHNKLLLLLQPWQMVVYYQPKGARACLHLLQNDRALALGLLAALLSICAHNLVDDLYVHSMTNLIALLLVALIRLEGGIAKTMVSEDRHFDYTAIKA